MVNDNELGRNRSRPVVIGTGLVALDAVVNGDANSGPRVGAGGTCANVLSILSFLGWDSFPVARHGTDAAWTYLKKDLLRWNVRLDFTGATTGTRTPVIVHYIHRRAEKPFHRFSWYCPNCRRRLPSFRPVRASIAQEIAAKMHAPEVFFMDRASRGALVLARASLVRGATIVFEPSGVGDPKLFKEALHLAHIVKYSRERLRKLSELVDSAFPLLEIETNGHAGLRFRSRIQACTTNGWEHMEAYKVNDLKDAAGCGDWCTAGVIHKLAQGGVAGVEKVVGDELRDALQFGQALAAWNCRFDGARGGMYCTSRSTLETAASQIMSGSWLPTQKTGCIAPEPKIALEQICPHCHGGADRFHREVQVTQLDIAVQ